MCNRTHYDFSRYKVKFYWTLNYFGFKAEENMNSRFHDSYYQLFRIHNENAYLKNWQSILMCSIPNSDSGIASQLSRGYHILEFWMLVHRETQDIICMLQIKCLVPWKKHWMKCILAEKSTNRSKSYTFVTCEFKSKPLIFLGLESFTFIHGNMGLRLNQKYITGKTLVADLKI